MSRVTAIEIAKTLNLDLVMTKTSTSLTTVIFKTNTGWEVDPNPETPHLKAGSRIPKPESQIPNPGFGFPGFGFRVSGTQNPESRILNPGF